MAVAAAEAERRDIVSPFSAPLPQWSLPLAALLAGGLAAHFVGTSGPAVRLLAAVAASGSVLSIVRRGTFGDLIATIAVCAAAARVGADHLGLGSPTDPFFGQTEGQPLLLAVGAGLLFLAVSRLSDRPIVAAVIALVFVASLAARGLLVVLALAVPIALRGLAPRAHGRPVSVWATCLVLLIGFASLLLRPASGPVHEIGSPRDEIAYWRARRNLFHAHAVALAWAKEERTPAEAYLALADLDLDLGDRGKARKVLKKVLRDGAAPARSQASKALVRATVP